MQITANTAQAHWTWLKRRSMRSQRASAVAILVECIGLAFSVAPVLMRRTVDGIWNVVLPAASWCE
jgi:hypothetical protein